jgi:hypothetical protein
VLAEDPDVDRQVLISQYAYSCTSKASNFRTLLVQSTNTDTWMWSGRCQYLYYCTRKVPSLLAFTGTQVQILTPGSGSAGLHSAEQGDAASVIVLLY